jgi:acetyl-CoA carboxylase carboxyl transferase subunit alpha
VIAAAGETIDRGFRDLADAGQDYREHRREKFLAIGRSL